VTSSASDIDFFGEPTCWGSGELPLLPEALKKAVGGITLKGLVRDKKAVRVPLLLCTSHDWRRSVGQVTCRDQSKTFRDVVVEAVSKASETDPDVFDVPVISSAIHHFGDARAIPVEVETDRLLFEAHVDSDEDMVVLLTSTFREIVDRLGDVRAALDVSVTGAGWLVTTSGGRMGFSRRHYPITLEEAQSLIGVRGYRTRGLKTGNSYRNVQLARVMGRRWAIGFHKAWTLDRCGEHLGLTRERVRQLGKLSLWETTVRMWGRPAILDELSQCLLVSDTDEITVESTGEVISRDDAVALVAAYGYDPRDFEPEWTLADELKELGIDVDVVNHALYVKSERLGLMSELEARHHIAVMFPETDPELIDDLLTVVAVQRTLPHGYLYLELRGTSHLKGWMFSLLGRLGALPCEDVYRALERFCRTRIPRLVFPSRAVVREWIEQDEAFWCVDDCVGLREPQLSTFGGVEKWMYDTIMGCTGHVIHKTELWERAREAGQRVGTLNVYSSYSLYFKPLGRGCITITGLEPSEVMLTLAARRAAAIRVQTLRESVSVSDGVMSIELQAGNALLDTGVLSTTVEIRAMLQGQVFAATYQGQQFGNVSWSGSAMTGLSQLFQAMQVQPGESVVLSFDVTTKVMEANFVAS